MKIFKTTKAFIALTVVSMIGSCSKDPTPSMYTKDWSLDLSEYTGAQYPPISGNGYPTVSMNDHIVLLSEYSNKGPHLIEINLDKKSFTNITSTNFAVLNLRIRSDDKILITGGTSNMYQFGFYNSSTKNVDIISSVQSSSILNPKNIFQIYNDDNFIYTHDPNVYYLDTAKVYIAKWDLNGVNLWNKVVDPTRLYKIAFLAPSKSQGLLFCSVKNSDQINEEWKVGLISAQGDVVWNNIVTGGRLNQIVMNSDNFFTIQSGVTSMISKYDFNGNLIWSKGLTNYQNGYTWMPRTTIDGGILIEYQNKNCSLIKLDANGNIVWQQNYWETSNQNYFLDFLDVPNGDIITTSFSGFITYYKRNK